MLQAMHPYLKALSSSSPTQETLYYIPMYTSQLYHSLLLEQKLSHQDSLNRTAEAVRKALNWVKTNFPYWNQSNGVNHFMVAPMDNGRCTSMAGLSPADFGDMFMLQTTGDRILDDFESHTWSCYKPGRDIIIPANTEQQYTVHDVVKPSDTVRNISILYRFVGGGRGEYGALRSAVLNNELKKPILGSASGWNTVHGTHEDMKHSVFCVCPPGIAQQTLRMYRAIIFGCIPITLFNSNDSPYQQITNLDYSKFSINVNPSEVHLLQPIVRGLFARPEKIRQMQAELVKVQAMFLWDATNYEGAFPAILQELASHPAQYILPAVSS